MRHAVAKEEFDGFQGSLIVLSPVYTQPLEIRRHQQLAPALKRSPNARAQGRLAHQHLTDLIGRDADSFHLGDSLAGGGRASPSEQINVTRELPPREANQTGRLIRRDVNNANFAREDHVAVKRLGTRPEELFPCCERTACAELRTFLQLGRGENRKGHRVLHLVGMELIWSLVHLLFIYLIRKLFQLHGKLTWRTKPPYIARFPMHRCRCCRSPFSKPPPGKPREPQAPNDVWAVPHQSPQETTAIVFNHQDNRTLIKPLMPGRYPPAIGIAGHPWVRLVERRFEAVRIQLCQFSLVNAMVDGGQHDLGRERQ